ncbi:hypothetical protein GALMADRAFT_1145059 [Galerina marginata CBS 339.88]|uniref:RING-type domain-containing protein n=1 Tax=Galerina marginata (strain CBS 339.88) TaxID=685588 RepID=A0A067S6S4_GALM3|nr:hypothetical protein GALMADRAFT_1145059 [Galerina marginata CBS 339.88]
MPSARCPVCFDSFSLGADKPEFVIYPCGHGCCTQCSDGLLSEESPKCPACRATLRRRDGHPLYLELVDSSDSSSRQEDETDVLRTELHRSSSDQDLWRSWAESLQTKIDQLTLSLEESESNTKSVIDLAETTKLELEDVREESVFWQERAEELDQQKARLEDQLERYIVEARREKKKNKELSKQVASLAQKLEEEDADAWETESNSSAYSHMAVASWN